MNNLRIRKNHILCSILLTIFLVPSVEAMFTQPDSVIQNSFNPKDLNHYTFVRNNPYKYTDPDGKDVVVVNKPQGALGAGHTYAFVGNPDTKYRRIEVVDKAGLTDFRSNIEITPEGKEFDDYRTDMGPLENTLVYKTDEETDKEVLAKAKKLKDEYPYVLGAYDCDTFISDISTSSGVGYHRLSSIPNLNFVQNVPSNILHNIAYSLIRGKGDRGGITWYYNSERGTYTWRAGGADPGKGYEELKPSSSSSSKNKKSSSSGCVGAAC